MTMQNDNGREDSGSVDDNFDHIENEELALVEDDGPLPWLESDYDDEEDEGADTGRLVGMALLAALLLALILGTVYFFSNRGPDPELVADGSTIEAPEGPMKERPVDAGGKEFAGTGNVAPSVGDGQTTEGRLADGSDGGANNGSAGVKPSIDAATTGSATNPRTGNGSGTGASNGGGSDTQSASSGGVGVQVGAYSTRESAVEGWNRLTRQTDALKGFKYRVQQGKADIGTVFRLQAVAGDKASASRLCSALKSDGIACQVK